MTVSSTPAAGAERTRTDVLALGPWFHNLHLPDGTQTAPDHGLGDFPAKNWERVAPHLPEDLSGWTALDVGCNAGFYAFELARRGAVVTAIDCDEHYLRQARWAAREFDLADRVRFERMQVYELAHREEQYDLVWFAGVMYHLRYPMLGLEIVTRRARRLLVFQTMTAPGDEVIKPPENIGLAEREWLNRSGWPTMAFIERRLADDPTNWWAANHACVEAMLRSCGMSVLARPADEFYLCEPQPRPDLGIGSLLEEEYRAATGQNQPRR